MGLLPAFPPTAIRRVLGVGLGRDGPHSKQLQLNQSLNETLISGFVPLFCVSQARVNWRSLRLRRGFNGSYIPDRFT